jgi:hypothetical protein
MEFYYKNYQSKNLAKRQDVQNGIRSLDSSETVGPFSQMYDSLQLFGFSLGSIGQSITGGVGGGFGGGIIPSSQKGSSKSDKGILDSFGLGNSTQITGALNKFGVNTSSFSQYLGGLTIGSLFDGSFLGGLLSNITKSMISWFSSRLSYVIGFDVSAFRSLFDDAFGEKWQTIIGTSPNGKSFLGSLGLGGSNDKLFKSTSNQSYQKTNDLIKPYEPREMANRQIANRFAGYFALEYMPSGVYHVEEISRTAWSSQIWGGPTEDLHGGLPNITVESSKDKAEVQFFKSMKEDTKKDFEDSMNAIKDEFNISIDRNTIVHKFNRFRVPTPDNELTGSIGYVFFTRPDLNLSAELNIPSHGVVAGASEYSPLMMNMLASHAGITSYLMGRNGSQSDNSHSFIPILTHCCTGFDISDETLDTVETGETFTGWKMNYGTSLVRSKSSGTLQIGFTDDNMLSVFKIIKVWIEYISSVYRGLITPKPEYAERHILDYAISIYYFLCNATGEDILFYTKYTGCFPTAAPSSNFSDTLGNRIKRPNYSVPFAYARKDDFNPLIIAEFDNLADTSNFKFLPIYNKETLRNHKSFVGAPFVDTQDGARLFKLRWRPPEE